MGHGDGSGNTDTRCESEHETNHDTGKITGRQGIGDKENVLVAQFVKAQVDTRGEKPDEHVEVEEEGRPSRRLVLRHRGDDGDVDLGITGVPERVETSTPCSNLADLDQEEVETQEQTDSDNDSRDLEASDLLVAVRTAQPVAEGVELNSTECA